MKRRQVTNIEASVRQRLKNLADAAGRPFAEALQWYAIERFLARLAATEHAQLFVLKGAALLRVWDAQPARPTMDIDLGAPYVMGEGEVVRAMRDCLGAAGGSDGLVFDPESLESSQIRIAHRYPGVRVRFRGALGVARVVMQVDVGFSDKVIPPAVEVEYPSMLGSTPARLRGYQPETVVAEKLDAMVTLGLRTSRMKDYFDLWWLAMQKRFEGRSLTDAVLSTFQRRGTEVPDQMPTALSDAVTSSPEKLAQWAAFIRRSQLNDTAKDLEETVRVVRELAGPVFRAARSGSALLVEWPPGGPWQESYQ